MKDFSNKKEVSFRKALSHFDGTALVVGSMIGSGIFFVTFNIAKQVPNPWLLLLVWALAGAVTIAGALSFAELSSTFPHAGGTYVYLKEAYGKVVAFLYGWTLFTVIQTGTIAAVAVAFAIALAKLIHCSTLLIKLMPAFVIWILTLINLTGIKEGAYVQNFFTTIKALALAGIVILSVAFTRGNWQNFCSNTPIHFSFDLLSHFGVALVAAFWAYDAWFNITFVAEEAKEPEKILPFSLFWGTLITTLLYVLVNVIYVYLLGVKGILASQVVGVEAGAKLFGNLSGIVINIIILFSTFGCINGILLAGARVYYAMARDGLFFSSLLVLHPRWCTPVPSLLLQGVWATVLAVSGTFENLFTYVIFGSWIFYLLSIGAVIVLRYKKPDINRPYKVPFYPFLPFLYLLFGTVFTLNTLIGKPYESFIGLGIIALGLPGYWFWKKELGGVSKKVL